MNDLKHSKYIKERRVIERIKMVGPNSEAEEVIRALYDAGFRMIRSGPYTNKRMFPKVDVERFLFVAERDIAE